MSGAAKRAPFGHYRELLAAAGFRPSRRLGQNFLLDPALQAWMAEAAAVGPADLMVEIGAGLGFLTRELAARAARVVAVEVDERLARILAAEQSGWERGDRVRLERMDALAKGRWNPDLVAIVEAERRAMGGEWGLVANLPYSVAGPLLGELPALPRPPRKGAVMLQEEVARRVTARPGTPDYGALSVQLQTAYRLELARRVGREVFWPKPAVGSAVVAFARREDGGFGERPPAERAEFGRFVRALFGQRRKKLANALAAALRASGPAGRATVAGSAELAELAERRPGELAPDQIAKIWARGTSSP